MKILEKIDTICSERNLSQYRIEKDCGFSNQSMRHWKKSNPQADALITLADYFNISLAWLCGRTENREMNGARAAPQLPKETIDMLMLWDKLTIDNKNIAMGMIKAALSVQQIETKQDIKKSI